MKRFAHILLFAMLLMQVSAVSQTPVIDSLKNVLKSASGPKEVEVLIQLAEAEFSELENLDQRDFNRIEDRFQKSFEIAQELNDSALIFSSVIAQARYQLENENYSQSRILIGNAESFISNVGGNEMSADYHGLSALWNYRRSGDLQGLTFSEKIDSIQVWKDRMIMHAEQALALYESTGEAESILKIKKELSDYYEYMGEFGKAEEVLTSLIREEELGEEDQLWQLFNLARLKFYGGDLIGANQLQDSILLVAQTKEYYDLTLFSLICAVEYHRNAGEYLTAQDRSIEVLDIIRNSPDSSFEAYILNNLGLVFLDQDLFQDALINLERSEVLSAQLGDEENVSNAMYNIGSVYKKQNKYEEALNQFRKCLKIELAREFPPDLAATYFAIGEIYYKMNLTKPAIDTLGLSLEIYSQLNSLADLVRVKNTLSLVHLDAGNLNQALKYAEESHNVVDDLEDPGLVETVYLNYSKVQEALGNEAEAFAAHKKYSIIRDSIRKDQSRVQISEVQEKYQNEVLEEDLDQQKLKNLKQERQLIIVIITALIIIMIVGGALFTYRYRQSKKIIKYEQEQVAKLKKLDTLKDDFLARTSHELRTPLNGIIGLSESMMDSPNASSDKSLSSNLSMIASSGRRLANLVNDILDFSKMKNHELNVNRKTLDLHTLVDVVMKISGTLLYGKDVKLYSSIANDLPGIYADEDRMQQIFLNLIGNAVKFTSEGEIELSAKVEGDMMHISIRDTGIGISKEHQQRIFDSFEQVEETSSRQFSGTGLGLTITKQLVELHDGKIWLESEPGVGSTFSFSIPVSTEDVEHFIQKESKLVELNDGHGNVSEIFRESEISELEQATESKNEIITPRALASGEHFNILVVDDEAINRQVMQNFLELEEDYTLLQASNGPEALQMLSKHDIDLVLLDIMMPGMSGYEVCAKIRETYLPSELPVIMVTAKGQMNDLVDGFRYGANDYLMKPVSKPELIARMRTHLNLLTINEAYGRFIPRDFIKALGHDNIIDVKLGDQVEGHVTILFSDIRKYTTLSEGMSIDDNFKFLNAYLKRMTPAVELNNGFIYKFLGDGIMALYHERTEDAVISAMEMQEELRIYNIKRVEAGREALEVGIGMHAGPLMLGILGDETRFDAGLVSDTVNSASRVEGLTKYYGAPIIISEEVLEGIADKEKYNYRFLAKSKVKGKTKFLMLYEILDPRMGESIQLKIDTKEDFEKALNLYFDRNFTEAIALFKKILNANPSDKAVGIYLEHAATYLIEGVPENWSGEEIMKVK